MAESPKCRHCDRRAGSRPRGLCSTCYFDTAVRKLCPSQSKYAPDAARVDRIDAGLSTPPASPTPHPVGSPEREAVMQERIERGESLFHPLDSRECVPEFEGRFRPPEPMTVPTGTQLRDE